MGDFPYLTFSPLLEYPLIPSFLLSAKLKTTGLFPYLKKECRFLYIIKELQN